MFDFKTWRPFSEEQNKKTGAWPNGLWLAPDGKVGALVVRKGPKYAEYALSKTGLDHLQAGVKQKKRIKQGVVVLADRPNGVLTVIAEKPVGEVVDALAGIPPRDGPLGGPYHWMNADLTPHVQPDLPDEEIF